ncbi:MAG TPA: gamma carbonic anhydrase family protein, partial [Symbiobacteriaceae bacterium]|nr:gamma carbonic anhydrase family protein [Symbiobacteriaceae bacterium]
MLHAYKGTKPTIGRGVFVAPGAHVIGKVTMGDESSTWFNTVVRGDADRIVIGGGTNIQDNTVVHCDYGFPTLIGENVTVGHGCIIHGCEIGDNCLIGMGSTILNGAKIGPGSLVGAGSLVTEGKEFPPGSVIMGRPAKLVRP